MKVPLADFLDYLFSTGTARLRAARGRADHALPLDFYKPVREAILRFHQEEDAAAIEDMLAARTDPREKRIFPKVVEGYQRFLRPFKSVQWFEPPAREHPLGSLDVEVCPELGLILDGKPHILKLYLRGDPVSIERIVFTNELLRAAFTTTWPGVVFGTVDVRRAKVYTARPAKTEIRALLRAEAESYRALSTALI